MITEDDWNAFVQKKITEVAKLLSKQRSELAKKNVHPHTMGSSGYAASIPKWEKEFEDAIITGKQILYANLDDRSKNWMLGRRSTSSSCAELSFNKPETVEVVNKLAEIRTQATQGSFVPDRENDVLTKALRTKEHPGRARGFGSKVPWKKGFSNDLYKSKSRRNAEQRRWEEYKAAFEEMYKEKKRKEREEQEHLAVPSS